MQRTTLTLATIESAINRKNCAKLREKTQEHRKPSKKLATPPETTALPTDNQTSERTQLHRTNRAKTAEKNLTPPIKNPNEQCKTRIHRTNLKQTANDGCTSTQPRRKLRKPPRTHAVDGSKFYTAPRWAPDDPAC